MFMVPTKFAATFFSPLFSWTTKVRMIREWFYRPVRSSGDSTVAEFVRRHYGGEMVERLADPLLAGVYGGSAEELSVRSVLPRFAEIEATQGSLGRGMIAARKRQASGSARPLFTSLKDGMQQMVHALLARIPASARRANIAVDTVKPESGKWLVVSSGRTEEFDAVIIATPAYTTAEMLAYENAELAAELSGIRYSSSVTVVLGFDQNIRTALPAGFGFLVPRSEGRRMLAATFVHTKFPDRAPENRALIRCFLGGTRDDAILQRSEDEILRIVQRELREILGITSEPLFSRIYKWKRAMAQYGLGHGDRAERIKTVVTGLPGLALAGNAYRGIGVPDCVRSGSEAAEKVRLDLASVST
jgi:oxygen-dependent protoporphyrinogen oxidase